MVAAAGHGKSHCSDAIGSPVPKNVRTGVLAQPGFNNFCVRFHVGVLHAATQAA